MQPGERKGLKPADRRLGVAGLGENGALQALLGDSLPLTSKDTRPLHSNDDFHVEPPSKIMQPDELQLVCAELDVGYLKGDETAAAVQSWAILGQLFDACAP